jgi:hypothetical protein
MPNQSFDKGYESDTPGGRDGSDNMRHWRDLCSTDPKHTKPFQRPGGFKGTAIKPIWNIMRLTEHFGPMGVGWGSNEPKFNVVDTGPAGEMMVYCVLECWFIDRKPGSNEETKGVVYGIGGDKIASRRSGAMFADDEAYKKAYTDALANGFLRIGVSADVHMGLFEDIKYLANVREHYDNTRAIQQQLEQPQGGVKAAE